MLPNVKTTCHMKDTENREVEGKSQRWAAAKEKGGRWGGALNLISSSMLFLPLFQVICSQLASIILNVL